MQTTDAGALAATKPLFCIDCKHYEEPTRRLADALCLATACRTANLVKGYQPTPCRIARRQGSACGPEGVHFAHISFGSAGQAIEGYSASADATDSPAPLMASATSSSAGVNR